MYWVWRLRNRAKKLSGKKGVEILRKVSKILAMRFGRHIFAIIAVALFGGASVRAENIVVGMLIDDSAYLFSSFGNQYTLGTTRGANFGGSTVSWYGVSMSSTSGANGISWTGSVATGAQYGYSGIYNSGSPGTAAEANSLTNTGIYGGSTSISISAIAGQKYLIDLLFANQFSGDGAGYIPYRTMDVKVGGLLYADDLTLYGTQSPDRRPLVYRFEVTPSSNSIQITFASGAVVSGSPTDQTPYVNAMMVTQVPEPSVLSLIAVGLGGLVLRRRRHSHLASCPDLGKRASCSL